MQPRIFISAVTSELGKTRQLAANVLGRLGYIAVWQDIFETGAGDLRQVLREKIDGCQGLLHLVGRAYGAEPPEPDADFGRVSYTQYELLYAQTKRKPTWIVFAEEDYPTDRPLEQLDLPPPGSPLDAAAYQQPRRQWQNAWREQLRSSNALWHEAKSRDEFELKVERLKERIRQAADGFPALAIAGRRLAGRSDPDGRRRVADHALLSGANRAAALPAQTRGCQDATRGDHRGDLPAGSAAGGAVGKLAEARRCAESGRPVAPDAAGSSQRVCQLAHQDDPGRRGVAGVRGALANLAGAQRRR